MIAPDSTAAAAVRTLTITPGGQAQFRFPYDPTLAEELRAAVGRCSWNGNPAARAFTLKVGPANIRAIVGFAKAHGFVGIARAEAIQARLFERVKERMVASRSPHEAEFRAALFRIAASIRAATVIADGFFPSWRMCSAYSIASGLAPMF